jgi:hypothetical protein
MGMKDPNALSDVTDRRYCTCGFLFSASLSAHIILVAREDIANMPSSGIGGLARLNLFTRMLYLGM